MLSRRIFGLSLLVMLASASGASGQEHKVFNLKMQTSSQGHITGGSTKGNAPHIATETHFEALPTPKTNVPHFVPHIETPRIR
jgi:hypothetical protein